MEQNRPKLDLPLTRAGKLLEMWGYIALVLLWVTTVVAYAYAPEVIPIHYNLAGEADGFGSRAFLFLTAGIGTLIFLIITLVARVPHYFNYLVTITEKNAADQYRRAQNMLRVIRILVMCMMLAITLHELFSANRKLGVGMILLEVLFIVVVPVLIAFSTFSLKKTKPNS